MENDAISSSFFFFFFRGTGGGAAGSTIEAGYERDVCRTLQSVLQRKISHDLRDGKQAMVWCVSDGV